MMHQILLLGCISILSRISGDKRLSITFSDITKSKFSGTYLKVPRCQLNREWNVDGPRCGRMLVSEKTENFLI